MIGAVDIEGLDLIIPLNLPVVFADGALEQAIRQLLDKPVGVLMREDVYGFSTLNLNGLNITNLAGLDACTNLKRLDLEENDLVDISCLAQQTGLVVLKLAGNSITDLSPLAGLTRLTTLTLGGNRIVDFSPIQSIYNQLVIRDFEFSILETHAGSEVAIVEENSGISLLFSEVTESGSTTVATVHRPPQSDSYFIHAIPVYYEINSTSLFNGDIIIEIPYSADELQGVEEHELRLYQYKNGLLTDITLDAPGNPDTVNKVIRGVIREHFCIFTIGLPNTAPVADAGDDQLLATSTGTAWVVLDGSGSYDPDETSSLVPSQQNGGKSIGSYIWTWDGGSAEGVNPLIQLPTGVHEVTLTVSDGVDRHSDSVYVIVYDPNGGFATGGGWIEVTDPADGNLGRASFGFIARYKNSAADGNFEFKYKDGDISLKSETIDWLVVNQNRAQFQGIGRLAGQTGVFTFRVALVDNEGNKKEDMITIRIWQGTDTSLTPIYSAVNVSLGGGNIMCKNK